MLQGILERTRVQGFRVFTGRVLGIKGPKTRRRAHQVHIQRQVGDRAERVHDQWPDGDVRHEAPVLRQPEVRSFGVFRVFRGFEVM